MAQGDDKPVKPVAQDQQAFDHYREIFTETMGAPLARIRESFADGIIDSRGLNKEMSFAEFLAAVSTRTTGKSKIAIRLDNEGLGKDASKLAEAKVKPEHVGETSAVHQVVQDVLRQVARETGSELDYAIRPEGVAITLPRLATYRAEYNLPKILASVDRAAVEAKHVPNVAQGAKMETAEQALTRVLTTAVPLRPWESAELVNGTRLVVNATPERHSWFVELLDQLDRLADIAVVMNARLLEVDRAFFDKHVAPLFAVHVKEVAPPEVVLVPVALFKLLAGPKPLIASDDVKLYRGRESVFLSRRKPVRFRPDDDPAAFGIEGISFTVDPNFTIDRRYIRLKITRHVDQLMGSKVRIVETPGQGKVEVTTPNVRQSSVSGTVQVADGDVVLMRCNYLPLGESNKDKVWLMLARPYIWIDHEQIERGVTSVRDYTKSIWQAEWSKPAETGPAKEAPPLNEATKEALQTVLTDVLTNPQLKALRDFYGTPGSNKLVLDDGGSLVWPKGFKPETPGYELIASKPDPFANRVRVLGIRLSSFDQPLSEIDWNQSAVEVRLFNAGGSANGAVLGYQALAYSVRRVEKRWVVRLEFVPEP
jgi:hypothetical protein